MKTRVNPFAPVYRACNERPWQDKVRDLPGAPTHVDVELTNRCNFRCLMCATRVRRERKGQGDMAEAVFDKLAAECATLAIPMRVIGWGEPTLHPKWLALLGRAKAKGIMLHFCTNGGRITEAEMAALIDMGLESMKFSFQGLDAAGYREMRNTDFFEALTAKVRRFAELRGERDLPFLHVSTTITNETPAQVQAFEQKLGRYADLVTVGRTFFDTVDLEDCDYSAEERARLDRLKGTQSVVKAHPAFCPEVFDKLTVNFDGTVSACCRDFDHQMLAGELAAMSLVDCWNSAAMRGYRALLAERRYEALPLCRTCYDYMGLTLPGLQDPDRAGDKA
jgi:organic radical activating enzyme